MNLGEKIIELRKKEGYSQEELASLLDVSRQSVSKWELNASTPDLDKIVRLSEIFHVSIDSLLQEDRIEPEEHVARLMPQTEVEALVNLKEKSRLYIAIAVFLFIVSPIALFVCGGGYSLGFFHDVFKSEDQAVMIGLIVLLILVSIGVAICVYFGSRLEKYEWIEKEPVRLSNTTRNWVQERLETMQSKSALWTMTGVTICILSVIPLFVSIMISEQYVFVGLSILLFFVACGVFIFIYNGTMKETYEALLNQGEYSIKNKQFNKKYSYLPGAYWCIVTAIYLAWSFTTNDWDHTWIVFAVGGVLFAAITILFKGSLEKK